MWRGMRKWHHRRNGEKAMKNIKQHKAAAKAAWRHEKYHARHGVAWRRHGKIVAAWQHQRKHGHIMATLFVATDDIATALTIGILSQKLSADRRHVRTANNEKRKTAWRMTNDIAVTIS